VVTGIAALTIDAFPAADPGLRGPGPVRTTGPAAADRFPGGYPARPGRTVLARNLARVAPFQRVRPSSVASQ
jgi:hypothetical protein